MIVGEKPSLLEGRKWELEGTIKKMAAKKWVHKSKKIEEVGRQKERRGEKEMQIEITLEF